MRGGTVVVVVAAFVLACGSVRAQNSAPVTYQGLLLSGGQPKSGLIDARFRLYLQPTGGTSVGPQLEATSVPAAEGRFSVELDFGVGTFTGVDCYIEVDVRDTGAGEYTTLAPRQRVTFTPQAAYAQRAEWTGLSGLPAGFADGVDDVGFTSAGPGLRAAGGSVELDLATTDARYVSQYAPLGGDLSGLHTDVSVLRLRGRTISPTAPASGQVLKFDGSQWGPAPDIDTNTTYSAGPGLQLTGTTFELTTSGVASNHLASQRESLARVTGGLMTASLSNPRIGINTANPAYALHVGGDIGLTGSLILPTQTRTYSVHAADFRTLDPASSHTYVGGLQGVTAGAPVAAFAPLHLPGGAIITGVDIYAFDEVNPDNFTVDLVAVAHATMTPTTIASVATGGNIAGLRLFSASGLNHSVNNAFNAYGLSLTMTAPATPAAHRLLTARVTYTVTSPLP